jgi:hypothetical protein
VKRYLIFFALLAIVIAACSDGGPAPPPSATTAVRPSVVSTAVPSGPSAAIEPAAGPPGAEVTVSGSGWLPGAEVAVRLDGRDASPTPYATVLAGPDGHFLVRFLVETLPDGGELNVGLLSLKVESGSDVVHLRYSVQTRRPLVSTPSAG